MVLAPTGEDSCVLAEAFRQAGLPRAIQLNTPHSLMCLHRLQPGLWRGTPAFYQNNTLLLEEVELPCIWAELYNPLPSEEFRSTITIHLTVER